MDKRALQALMGSNLYKARLNAGLTQEKLAEMAGISPSYCTNLERGRKGMSADVLRRLADALNVSADSLLYSDDRDIPLRNILAMLRDQPDETLITAESVLYCFLKEKKRREKMRL